MAIQFDETNDYYVITDAAELTFQDGDWCFGVWVYINDNSGADAQYLASNNDTADNNSFNLWLAESDSGVNADKWALKVIDGDGTTPATLRTSVDADNTWRLIICQRDDSESEIQIWFCEKDGASNKESSVADTNFAAINGGNWNIGRRVDGDADRYYGSVAAEVFKGNFALTSAQITALGAGLPIKTLAKKAGLTLDLYLPMWEADVTLLDYSNSGNSAARQDVPTTSAHPPICTPIKRHRMG